MKVTIWIRLATAACLAMAGSAQAAAGTYAPWQKVGNRYECKYSYKKKDGAKGYQKVLAYPKSNPRYGWAYYVNAKGKAWGRCAVPGNPSYKPKKMYWQRLKKEGDGYANYKGKPAGYCPAPADGVEPISRVPDPPF